MWLPSFVIIHLKYISQKFHGSLFLRVQLRTSHRWFITSTNDDQFLWHHHHHMLTHWSLRDAAGKLTHWGRVTHICVSKIITIGSDNGLSPDRRQAIIGTNAGILLIGPWGTNFSEISIGIQTFSFKKMHLKMSSAKWRPFCLGLNVF